MIGDSNMFYDIKKSGERIRLLRKQHGYTQEERFQALDNTARPIYFCAVPCGPIETGRRGSDRARMPPAGAVFGMAVSVDPVRVHNETPSHSLGTRHVGLPWG